MKISKVLAAVAVIIVLGLGAFIVFINGSPAPTTTNSTTQTTGTTTNSTAGDTVVIETSGFKFTPSTIRIKAGGTITYTNKDSIAHTLTASDGKSFDSGLVNKDQTVTITAPNEPGTYSFHCTPHPQMTGTLIVE